MKNRATLVTIRDNELKSLNVKIRLMAESNWKHAVLENQDPAHQLVKDVTRNTSVMGEPFRDSPEYDGVSDEKHNLPLVTSFIKRVLFKGNENESSKILPSIVSNWSQGVFTFIIPVLEHPLNKPKLDTPSEKNQVEYKVAANENIQFYDIQKDEDGTIHVRVTLGITIKETVGTTEYSVPGTLKTDCVLKDGFQLDWEEIKPSNDFFGTLINSEYYDVSNLETDLMIAEKKELQNFLTTVKSSEVDLFQRFGQALTEDQKTFKELPAVDRNTLLTLAGLLIENPNNKTVLKQFIAFSSSLPESSTTLPESSTNLNHSIKQLNEFAQQQLKQIALTELVAFREDNRFSLITPEHLEILKNQPYSLIQNVTGILINPFNKRLMEELSIVAKQTDQTDLKKMLIDILSNAKDIQNNATIEAFGKTLEQIDNKNIKSIAEKILKEVNNLKSQKIDPSELANLVIAASKLIEDPNFSQGYLPSNNEQLKTIVVLLGELKEATDEYHFLNAKKELHDSANQTQYSKKIDWSKWQNVVNEKRPHFTQTMKLTTKFLADPTNNLSEYRTFIENLSGTLGNEIANDAAELYYYTAYTSLRQKLNNSKDGDSSKLLSKLIERVELLKRNETNVDNIIALGDLLLEAKKTKYIPSLQNKLSQTTNLITKKMNALVVEFKKLKPKDEPKSFTFFKRDTGYTEEQLDKIKQMKLEFIELLKSIPFKERINNPAIKAIVNAKDNFIDFHRSKYKLLAFGSTNTREIVDELMSPPKSIYLLKNLSG